MGTGDEGRRGREVGGNPPFVMFVLCHSVS